MIISKYLITFFLATSDNQTTLPAKGLETLAMVYAIGELRNPLPRKTVSFEGDMNNPAGRSDAFLQR